MAANHSDYPLAYHLVWTTYGSWLPGDERGWINRKQPGVRDPDAKRQADARDRMRDPEVMLSTSQREIVDTTIRKHCELRGWRLHALNVRTNHVHVVVTACAKPEKVMGQLKAWCSRMLSEASKNAPATWWTREGSRRYVESEAYLQNVIEYVMKRQ